MRKIKKNYVSFPEKNKIDFSASTHNAFQKIIIAEFLSRYGCNSEVFFVNDIGINSLFFNESGLNKLNIKGNLAIDIIAYSKVKNWLYLIENIHSNRVINETRLLELKNMSRNFKGHVIYITAFTDKETFRKNSMDIAWETEVWIADNPDHLIHFNGDKFLGPYKECSK